MTESLIKPFLKWPGGKLRVVSRLKSKFPDQASRYIEPFLGAGSVALNVKYPEYIVNDTNPDLIQVWKCFQKMGLEFVEECEKFFTEENNTEEQYLKFRNKLNQSRDENDFLTGCLFVYLNRHCFNGLCRYNSKGNFNVPVGRYKKPYFPKKEFERCWEQVKKFQIYQKDFREIFEMVRENDLVYCDPPYLPLSETASFDAYSTGGFSLQDQIDLAACASNAAEKGATVIISNHCNWYARQIYTNMYDGKMSKIKVSRTISSKTDKREPVDELIIVFERQK